MSSPSEAAALVVLLRTGARPWQQYADLVEQAGSALAVLDRERGGQGSLFAADDADADAAADVDAWRREGIALVSVLDAEYPHNLRTVHDRPPLIFVDGVLRARDSRSIAVIGAREATSVGRAAAADIARHLVEQGYTVVSGLATGIDAAAHTAALAHEGRTVAVIGTRLKRVYPPQNAALQRRIARQGAVVSQFWPDAPPTRRTFPMRNALMSGMTLASVVVEASQTSGARMQARLALEQGRAVFLLEPLLSESWARELARRPGTRVVRAAHEITATVERLLSGSPLMT
jgi:DNA processing protein